MSGARPVRERWLALSSCSRLGGDFWGRVVTGSADQRLDVREPVYHISAHGIGHDRHLFGVRVRTDLGGDCDSSSMRGETFT